MQGLFDWLDHAIAGESSVGERTCVAHSRMPHEHARTCYDHAKGIAAQSRSHRSADEASSDTEKDQQRGSTTSRSTEPLCESAPERDSPAGGRVPQMYGPWHTREATWEEERSTWSDNFRDQVCEEDDAQAGSYARLGRRYLDAPAMACSTTGPA